MNIRERLEVLIFGAIVGAGLGFLCIISLDRVPTVQAQTTSVGIGTLADITGNGATHQVSATVQGARWIKFSCLTGNSAPIRIGDSNTSSSRGAACAAGSVMEFPPLHAPPYSYDLSKVYYYAANSDKLTVTYGK
jgi:hypothetical protein